MEKKKNGTRKNDKRKEEEGNNNSGMYIPTQICIMPTEKERKIRTKGYY